MKTPMELLKAAGALDSLARDLYRHHRAYLGEPIEEWTAIPRSLRQIYVELSARTLRLMSTSQAVTTEDALFHLANALGRADMVSGLRGKVIGGVFPRGTIQ